MAHIFVIGALAGSIVGACSAAAPRGPRFHPPSFRYANSSPSRKRQQNGSVGREGVLPRAPDTGKQGITSGKTFVKVAKHRTLVKIKKKHTAQKPDADGFWDAETPEQFSTRKQETEERVAGIEALLKEQAAKLLRSQQTAEASVSALAAVISEKNTVERMLEEMERRKEAAYVETESLRGENSQLLDTVTVLTDARASDHLARAVTVRKWRNELVAYREKTPAEFLSEILTLVSDMDNEVTIEIADATVMASRLGGGMRSAKAEEIALFEESSDHNPRLAMAAPERLCRLASRARERTALGDGLNGRVLNAAHAGKEKAHNRGTSGAEIKMTTPTQAAKRRAALGAIHFNAAAPKTVVASSPAAVKQVSAIDQKQALLLEMQAARLEMRLLKSESVAFGLLDAPVSPDGNKQQSSRHGGANGFGVSKASVSVSFFSAATGSRNDTKKSPQVVRQSRAAAAVSSVAKRQQKASAVFDDFGSENAAPRSRAVVVSPRG